MLSELFKHPVLQIVVGVGGSEENDANLEIAEPSRFLSWRWVMDWVNLSLPGFRSFLPPEVKQSHRRLPRPSLDKRTRMRNPSDGLMLGSEEEAMLHKF